MHILDRFMFDLLLILRDTLTNPSVDLLRNKQDVKRLEFRVLETLSRPIYTKHLLWRGNYDSIRYEPPKRKENSRPPTVTENAFLVTPPQGEPFWLWKEAGNYFYKVLCRRLGVANNLEGRPPNTHLLLKAGCRFGPAEQGWNDTIIKRDKTLNPSDSIPTFFQRTIEALNRQRQVLDPERIEQCGNEKDNSSAVRQHQEFGPLWLIVADCCIAEIAPELSLFYDVLAALPTPLRIEFDEDRELRRRLQRVLQALNERYSLLLYCGLDPETWFDSEDISINVLKQIKELRNCVNDANGLQGAQPKSRLSLYESCFNQLKEGNFFAGFRSFNEFLETEIGNRVCGSRILIDEKPEAIENLMAASGLADLPWECPEEITPEKIRAEITPYPQLADDPLICAFLDACCSGHILDKPETLANLRSLINKNPDHRRKFGKLSDRKLLLALSDYVQHIVKPPQ